MSKKSKHSEKDQASTPIQTPAQAAAHCAIRADGIIHVARPYTNPAEPFSKIKTADVPDYLGMVDHDLTFASKKDYEHALAFEERRLNILVRKLAEATPRVAPL